MTQMTLAPATTRPLVNADRCDRCGAAAQVVARNETNMVLLFCNHHGDKHSVALLEQNWYLDDKIELVD